MEVGHSNNKENMWSKDLEGSPKSRHVGLDGRRKVGVNLVENASENNATSPVDRPKSGFLIGKDSLGKSHVEVRATNHHNMPVYLYYNI